MIKQEPIRQGDEKHLWNAFRAGDKQAFTGLYSQYVRTLYNYGRKFSGDQAFVEDCIQDLFVELWKNRTRLGETDSAKSYLFKSLRRKICRTATHENKHQPEKLRDNEYNFEVELSVENNLISDQTTLEQRLYIEKALQTLTKRQQEAIFLRFYENLSYEEVAAVMSLELRSVYNLISKAIDGLKRSTHQALLVLLLFLFC